MKATRSRTAKKRERAFNKRVDQISRLGPQVAAEAIVNAGTDHFSYQDTFFLHRIISRQIPVVNHENLIKLVKLFNRCSFTLKETDAGIQVYGSGYSKIDVKRQKKVYVVRVEGQSVIKVGIALDPEKRLKALQVGNPNSLVLARIYSVYKKGRTARVVEKKIHKSLKKYSLKGEWFEGVTEKDVDGLMPGDIQIELKVDVGREW